MQFEPDLQYLLEEKGVPKDLQQKIHDSGCFSVGVFSLLADSVADLRIMMKDEWKLEVATRRVDMAKVLDAWREASTRKEGEAKVAAEARATVRSHTSPFSPNPSCGRQWRSPSANWPTNWPRTPPRSKWCFP